MYVKKYDSQYNFSDDFCLLKRSHSGALFSSPNPQISGKSLIYYNENKAI